MTRAFRCMALGILWAAAMLPSPVTGQTPVQAPPPAQTPAPPNNPRARLGLRDAPVTNVSVDGSEAMFATMCALLAAGFEADVSSENWTPMRAQLRDRMQHQQGPAVDAVREFYKKHELADAGAMPRNIFGSGWSPVRHRSLRPHCAAMSCLRR